MAERLYFAYGSNINLEQMAVRCPAAQVVGPAVLDGYELLFRGNRRGTGVATIEPLPGSQVHGLLWKLTPECERSLDVYEGYPRLYEKENITPAVLDGYELLFRGNRRGTGVATIEPLPGSQVHGLLWKLTPECERSLDVYEGYPRLYEKENITVRTGDGKDVVVMAYIMTGELWRDPTIPSPAYYGGILEGYRQNGLPVPELEAALKNVHDEVRQARHFERMQEMDLFFGEKPGRKKGHHER